VGAVSAILAAAVPAGLLLAGATAGLGASFRLMRFPDLTVEGSFLLGAAVWAAATIQGWSTTLASLAGLTAGAACGGVTAMLSRIFGIDRFLSGILVTAACYSLALIVLRVSNLGLFDSPDIFFPGFDLSGTPWVASGAFGLLIAAGIGASFMSRAGIRARIAAINPAFLEAVSGRSLPYLVGGLALTNAAAAASGMAFSRYQGFVDVGMGQGVLIVALAGFAIGEACVKWLPISTVAQTMLAALAGSILYQIALGVAHSAGVPAAATRLFSAFLVLAFLVLQTRRGALAEQPL
jgi:putative ABC transport system permease protein